MVKAPTRQQIATASPIAEELRQAAEQMTPRERMLCDALIELVNDASDVAIMLRALATHSREVEAVAMPIAELLDGCATRALGVHAAAVADANAPAVH